MLDFIDLPDYFDRSKFFNAFQALETKDLYAYFRCNNSTTFTNLMRKYFPDRPLGTHVADYVRELIRDEEEFNRELGTEPRVQQAVVVEQPKTSKSFLSATGGEPEVTSKITLGSTHVDEWDKPAPVVQPRIRTEDDIWLSKQLFKEAGRTTQNKWLKAGHPDPKLETEDAPYVEEDVFTNLS